MQKPKLDEPMLNRTLRSGKIRSLRRDQRGTITIMAAIVLPVMVGAMALGAETSLRYFQQRNLHHAADVAAHGAGVRFAFGDPESVYDPIGRELAVTASWDESGAYEFNRPPQNGQYAGQSVGPNGGTLIEVALTEVKPRLFSKIWNNSDLTISAYAVAEVLQKRDACVLALDNSAPRAMDISGSASLDLVGCDTASNSDSWDSVYQGGSSNVSADCVYARGLIDESGGISVTDCPEMLENQGVVADPYAEVGEPAIEGPCENWNSLTSGPPHATKNIDADYNHSSGVPSMRFCSQDVRMQQRINFGPGLYILDGVDMEVNANADVNGSELMFYLVNGARLKINGSGELNLSAMTNHDDWAPILFFVSRTNSATSHQMNGDSNSSFEGLTYVPNAAIDYNGGSGLSGACTQVIGNTVTFTGNNDFQSDCTDFPFKDIVIATLVQLID